MYNVDNIQHFLIIFLKKTVKLLNSDLQRNTFYNKANKNLLCLLEQKEEWTGKKWYEYHSAKYQASTHNFLGKEIIKK